MAVIFTAKLAKMRLATIFINVTKCQPSNHLISRFQSTVSAVNDEKLRENQYKITPCESYDSKVSAGDLSNDTHQREVMEQLTHLHGRLKNYVPPSIAKPSFFSQWFNREEKRIEKIPRGVYVWGTVGGGKEQKIYMKLNDCY